MKYPSDATLRDQAIHATKPTPEMCRLFHGIDCRKCFDQFDDELDRLVWRVETYQRDTKLRGKKP